MEHCLSSPVRQENGYTLIELIMVVVLVALLTSFFVSRFTFSSSWSVDSVLRELTNKVEFVILDSSARQISYQIEFNLMEHSYQIWEIKTPDASESVQVDTLAGLRSQGERARREQRQDFQSGFSAEEEHVRTMFQDARPLDELLYQRIFDDPFGIQRRIPSLEYPALSEKVFLPPEVRIEDVFINQLPAPSLYSPASRIIFVNPSLGQLHMEIALSTDKGNAIISSNPFTNTLSISYSQLAR
jgi:prepilin-type N-terminal cleavage/methylation domain-containing protein